MSEGETVTLGAAQEIASLNCGLKGGRSARSTGVFQGVDGQPARGQSISLSINTRTVGNALQSNGAAGSARTDANGAFEFRNLAPGEYIVSTGGNTDRVDVTVILSEGDERSVTLTPQQPVAVSGIIKVDQEPAAPFAATRLRVTTVSDPGYVPPNSFTTGIANVTSDWTFRYANLIGPYLFRVDGLPDDWLVARVTANGRDVTDVPLEIGPGRDAIGSLQITISGKGATLNGEVTGANGRATSDATVIVFAADSSRWSLASRYIKVGRPQADGRFSIAGLSPSRYLVVARESIADGQWEDPSFLRTLVDAAQSFVAVSGETATMTLRLERAP